MIDFQIGNRSVFRIVLLLVSALLPLFGVVELELSVDKKVLNKESNTTYTLMAKDKNGKTETVTESIEWIISTKDAIKIEESTITAIKDTDVTIQARYKGRVSNPVTLHIYWEVEGHTLPPEPDPKVNNATLLGVDVNNNGVRDDVERWIYKEYKNPIERGIMLQNAYGLQKKISNIGKAHEYIKLTNKSLSCEYYLEEKYDWFRRKYEYTTTTHELKKIQFNTIKRHIAYERYNAEFNGKTFDEKILPDKNNCDFDKNGNIKSLP